MNLAFFVQHANVRKPESIKALGEIISSLREVHNPCLSLVSRHTIVEKHGCAAICTMMLILSVGRVADLGHTDETSRRIQFNSSNSVRFIRPCTVEENCSN